MIELYKLICEGNEDKIIEALKLDPSMANAGIPCSDDNAGKKGHPLHRICDAVYAKKISENQAIEIAKILLAYGADIDGYKSLGDNNTPLIAAASLSAEQVGIFYIEQGADIFYADKNDGATALHWAALCGLDKLVEKLIESGADINQQDRSYKSTPIGWAVHTLTSGGSGNLHHQSACIELLLKAGADSYSLNNSNGNS